MYSGSTQLHREKVMVVERGGGSVSENQTWGLKGYEMQSPDFNGSQTAAMAHYLNFCA